MIDGSRVCASATASEVVPALMKELGYTNVMQVPRLEKIVLNMGLGEAMQNPKIIDSAVEELTAITGQKPVVTKRARRRSRTSSCARACRSACMVTLRGERMCEFLDRLVNVALPRVRDFRASPDGPSTAAATTRSACASRSSSPRSNYDKVDKIKGLNISIVHDGADRRRGQALLRALGMPFRA